MAAIWASFALQISSQLAFQFRRRSAILIFKMAAMPIGMILAIFDL